MNTDGKLYVGKLCIVSKDYPIMIQIKNKVNKKK